MRPARCGVLVWLCVVLALAVGTNLARAADNPFVKLDSQADVEIDLKMVVGDFLDPLLESMSQENAQQTEWTRTVVDLLGVRALDRLRVQSTSTRDGGHSHLTLTMDPTGDEGLLGRLLAVGPGDFRFGRYLKGGDTVMLACLASFSQTLATLWDFMTGPQLRPLLPFLGESRDGRPVVFGIDPAQDLFPLLAGELDFMMFPSAGEAAGGEAGGGPGLPSMALVLGTTDGPALRAKILEIAGTFMGEDAARSMSEMEGSPVGDFMLYPLPAGVSYAVSRDFLVVTTDSERMQTILSKPAGDLQVQNVLKYVRLNGDVLADLLAAQAKHNGGGTPEATMQAELVRKLKEMPMGVVELKSTAQSNRFEMDVNYPGTVWNLEYQMLKDMAIMAPKMQAIEKKRAAYAEDIREVDAAMTSYGTDHDGFYPAEPHVLVQDGYLDFFPDLESTPLGQYREGAYSYVPLRDENGDVAGYYFFVYGMGEGTGYDVFTPENLSDPEHFAAGHDGKPDGVVNFCYDGTAVEQVDAWREGSGK